MPHPASPLHQPRSPSAPPLPLPALRLPTQRRRHGAAAVCASLAHGVLMVGLLGRGGAVFGGGGKGPGPSGGGGGRPAVQFFALPALSAPQQFDVPAPPAVAVADIPLPDPAAIKLPSIDVPKFPPPPPGAAPAPQRGGPAPGPRGGEGRGPGPGAGGGPGRGGGGGNISPPPLKGFVSPPPSRPRRR